MTDTARFLALSKIKEGLHELKNAPATTTDLVAGIRELAYLYVMQDELNDLIETNEEQLRQIPLPRQSSTRRAKKETTRRRSLQKPSLDVLALFKDDDALTRVQVIERGLKTYRDLYSDRALSSTLSRLVRRGALVFDSTYGLYSKK